jgi:hypothetical protein
MICTFVTSFKNKTQSEQVSLAKLGGSVLRTMFSKLYVRIWSYILYIYRQFINYLDCL